VLINHDQIDLDSYIYEEEDKEEERVVEKKGGRRSIE
jgi:hypothetical protein